jgi:hypothetical protein
VGKAYVVMIFLSSMVICHRIWKKNRTCDMRGKQKAASRVTCPVVNGNGNSDVHVRRAMREGCAWRAGTFVVPPKRDQIAAHYSFAVCGRQEEQESREGDQ